MFKTTTLSKIVMAVIVAAFSIQTLQAQSNGQGFAPQQPRYMPPQRVHRDQMVRPAGFQEEVEVPSILSGQKKEPAAAAPPIKPPAAPAAAAAQSQQQAIPVSKDLTLPPQQSPFGNAASEQPPANMSQPFRSDKPELAETAMQPRMQAQHVPTQDANQFNSNNINQVSGLEPSNSLRTQPIDIEPAMQPQESQIESPLEKLIVQEESQMITTEIARMPAGEITQTISQPGLSTTDGPKLRVTSTGPSSITIGKTARFEVLVENLEARSANSVIVGIDLPEWIEVASIMPTTGSQESTDGTEESLMVWQIPIVEAMTTEKIVIDVIPREARPFDIDVEWTFKPIRGKTTVEVTQPQLSIQISGPTEVQFGEKALYDVTVSNPGTGIAENVSVMLPEVLGGERAKLDDIAPQQQKKFQVELIARSAGTLDLTTTVLADGNLKESDTREIIVRRAVLDVALEGPPMKYAGSVSTYKITVSNQGDAMARDVIAAVALPPGVEFESGIDNVEKIDGGIRWKVGMLSPGNQRTYQLNCSMNVAGDINIDAATRGAGDLAATSSIVTRVDAVADLVLSVADPKGPLPTGQEIVYEIKIVNRGSKSARGVNIVMHFSDGIEPGSAEGIASDIAPGQVTFSPIAQIDPEQEVILKVKATAVQPGSHRFRAQLLCEADDSHEVTEGTTRFFGESTSTADKDSDTEEFKR